MRVVIAEDSVLLREGFTRLLEEPARRSSPPSATADELITVVERAPPDLAVVDVRMPPTYTDEGLRAAIEIRPRCPAIGILVLSQYVEERYASELLAAGASATCSRTAWPTLATSSSGAAGCGRRHRARPRGRRAAARPPAAARPAGDLTAARARGPGADGRGPQNAAIARRCWSATARSRSTRSAGDPDQALDLVLVTRGQQAHLSRCSAWALNPAGRR